MDCHYRLVTRTGDDDETYFHHQFAYHPDFNKTDDESVVGDDHFYSSVSNFL